MTFTGFPKDLITFLKDLEQNNDKAWFAANKARYEASVQQPALEFVAALAPRIQKISKHITAEAKKSGGSLMRIYRDTRFAKDKSPYNTHVTAVFRHAVGKETAAPGYYFRVQSGELHIGAGIFQPDGPALAKIRAAIDGKQRAFVKARDHAPFVAYFGGLGGDSLKRPPKGFDPDHPLIEDLKRKDLVAFRTGKPKGIHGPGLLDDVEAGFEASKPLMRFLCDALELPF